MGLFCTGLFERYGTLRPQPIALGPARRRRLHHTGVFPILQAMARTSLFQSPLLTQLQRQLEAQIKDQLGQRVRAMTGATGDARDFLQPAGDPGLFGPGSAASTSGFSAQNRS